MNVNVMFNVNACHGGGLFASRLSRPFLLFLFSLFLITIFILFLFSCFFAANGKWLWMWELMVLVCSGGV